MQSLHNLIQIFQPDLHYLTLFGLDSRLVTPKCNNLCNLPMYGLIRCELFKACSYGQTERKRYFRWRENNSASQIILLYSYGGILWRGFGCAACLIKPDKKVLKCNWQARTFTLNMRIATWARAQTSAGVTLLFILCFVPKAARNRSSKSIYAKFTKLKRF